MIFLIIYYIVDSFKEQKTSYSEEIALFNVFSWQKH